MPSVSPYQLSLLSVPPHKSPLNGRDHAQPVLALLPPHFGVEGVWFSMPLSDTLAFIIPRLPGAAGLWQSAYGWQRGTLFAGL